jgi:hypothetical protein
MWMKMVIVFLFAVGPRSNEMERFNILTQINFGDDPHVHFQQRKNLTQEDAPERVPIMLGINYLRAYRDYIQKTGGNGSLVPSPRTETGCRAAGTINNWLKRLCKIANVRLPDGTLPTIQNFRRLWKTEYLKAVYENREYIRFVSDEGGTDTPEVDEEDYISDVVNRRQIRELGREHFDSLLEIDELPELIKEELDQTEYLDRQSSLSDY